MRVDWGSPTWGQQGSNVHEAENASWLDADEVEQ